ncbi:hypothetical protein BGZ91_002355 [Linnemannia elongata]|nr:hypothetical protein BGZ91_002355 [Linnemannia elongata]
MTTTTTLNFSGQTSSTTTLITNATSKVIALPELIEHIGHHLDSSLFPCVQVCRLWNRILTPLLWHTVNIDTMPWLKKFDKVANDRKSSEETEMWIKLVFERHGRHIRHLDTYWSSVIEVASLDVSNCRNLVSLTFEGERYTHSAPTALVPDVANNINNNYNNYLPSPLQQHNDGNAISGENLRHRWMFERFFSLIRQNPGLVRIQFPLHGAVMTASKTYIFETLSLLRKLKELDQARLQLDMATLLETVPQLERLRRSDFPSLFSLQQQYPSLRVLHLGTFVNFTPLLEMLKHLPGLEELRFEGILGDPGATYTVSRDNAEASESFRNLSTLQFDDQWRHEGTHRYIVLLLRLVPNLVRLLGLEIHGEVKKALWDYCYFLDEIRDVNQWDIEPWRQRRADDASR